MRKKVFLYVGHSNWGKSYTLKHITDGNSRKKVKDLFGRTFRVRKMSNDDDESKLLEFVKSISKTYYQNYIIAFCPRQLTSERTQEIINILHSTADLYFFVQKSQFYTNMQIDNLEIESLCPFGEVEILESNCEFQERAELFLRYIERSINNNER